MRSKKQISKRTFKFRINKENEKNYIEIRTNQLLISSDPSLCEFKKKTRKNIFLKFITRGFPASDQCQIHLPFCSFDSNLWSYLLNTNNPLVGQKVSFKCSNLEPNVHKHIYSTHIRNIDRHPILPTFDFNFSVVNQLFIFYQTYH